MDHSGIAIVIGTKAELIKCMPIMLELQKRKKDYWFVHTGQHLLGETCKLFGIKQPDFILSKEPKRSTKFWSKINKNSLLWFISMIFRIKKKVTNLKPKYIIYHGDTMSTAAVALGSSKLLNIKKNWKNVHLEAGLRSGSFSEPFPEEISRVISDYFSDVLFAVSEISEQNLTGYKNKKVIINFGNTIIDSTNLLKKVRGDIPKERYALINVHRHENLRDKERMKKIVDIISKVGISSIWPIHDNTLRCLNQYNLTKKVKNLKKLKLVDLMDYSHFIFLLKHCEYLLTDGGSIQEESLIFKKPCIILRKRTERQEGLKTGINFLTKLNVEKTKILMKKIEMGEIKVKNFKNPYGSGGLSKRIVDYLLKK